ncbi:hypothetical protein DPX16_0278 [Anabarilius grahami]|uniref:Uncharacterized protein n=1 Tax=Anabarilius grahami TaxID=495550 RepID=A0A3N0YRI0_ANAGA|nr:hypothetical protein DPX16_0278 [Anabarilius grahami]
MGQHMGWKRGEENTEFDEFGTEHIRRLIISSLILAEAFSPGKKLAALEEALPPLKRPCSGPAESPDSPPLPTPAPVSARLLPPSGASRAFPAVYYRI